VDHRCLEEKGEGKGEEKGGEQKEIERPKQREIRAWWEERVKKMIRKGRMIRGQARCGRSWSRK